MPARDVAIQEVAKAMLALKLDIAGEMNRRDLSASGAMIASLDDEVTQDDTSTTGTLSALDYWVNVGSGTPPGSGVKEADIAQWMEDKGFEGANIATAFFITRKINREGSKAYRQGLPNAFDTAIDAWEASALMQNLGERTANQYGDSFIEILRNNIQN